jgi:hypothetical protein
MNALLSSTLLLLTIIAAFTIGIAAGYWVLCGFLHCFDPGRPTRSAKRAPALAPTSGD